MICQIPKLLFVEKSDTDTALNEFKVSFDISVAKYSLQENNKKIQNHDKCNHFTAIENAKLQWIAMHMDQVTS